MKKIYFLIFIGGLFLTTSFIAQNNKTAIVEEITNIEHAPTNYTVFPNPSKDFIKLVGITKTEKYTIYNVLGKVIKKSVVEKNKSIDVKEIPIGLYIMEIEGAKAVRFIKK